MCNVAAETDSQAQLGRVYFILFIFFRKPFQAPHLFFTRLFSAVLFVRHGEKTNNNSDDEKKLNPIFFYSEFICGFEGYSSRAEGAKKSNSHFSDGTAGYPPENQTVVFHEASDRIRQQL